MSQLTTVKLIDWLKPLLTSGAVVVAGRVPDMPNRVIGIQRGSGAGLEMNGLFDAVGFIITCRGGENNFTDAENIAVEIDNVMIGKHPTAKSENFLIGTGVDSVYVSEVGRVGSGPIQLALPDPQSRVSFTCSYFARVSTDVGQVYNG